MENAGVWLPYLSFSTFQKNTPSPHFSYPTFLPFVSVNNEKHILYMWPQPFEFHPAASNRRGQSIDGTTTASEWQSCSCGVKHWKRKHKWKWGFPSRVYTVISLLAANNRLLASIPYVWKSLLPPINGVKISSENCSSAPDNSAKVAPELWACTQI